MNVKQRIVIYVATGAMFVILLFPPYLVQPEFVHDYANIPQHGFGFLANVLFGSDVYPNWILWSFEVIGTILVAALLVDQLRTRRT